MAYENKKFSRGSRDGDTGKLIIQDIIDSNIMLIPCTIDSGGRPGPIMQHFLWNKHPIYDNFLKAPDPRPTTGLCKMEQATILLGDTLKRMPHNILKAADEGWKETNGTERFTRHEKTPSEWATNTIACNVGLALGMHLYQAVSHTRLLDKEINPHYMCASSKPRRIPVYPILKSLIPIQAATLPVA
jgi:hypothetical protein